MSSICNAALGIACVKVQQLHLLASDEPLILLFAYGIKNDDLNTDFGVLLTEFYLIDINDSA